MKIIICYDIKDNKLRYRLVKYLERIGIRIQLSVFKADLKYREIIKLKNFANELLKEEKYGVTKFDNDIMKITYFAPSTSTSIDSTRLKKEQPDIAKEYSKTSNKKSYIKIEVKAGDK